MVVMRVSRQQQGALAAAFAAGFGAYVYYRRSRRSLDAAKALLLRFAAKGVVVMGDVDACASKLAKMSDGGAEELCVLCDFEGTLTTPGSPSSYSLLEPHFSELYQRVAKVLNDVYAKAESAGSMAEDERVVKMKLWYNATHQAMLHDGLIRPAVDDAVKAGIASGLALREGVHLAMRTLEAQGVPLQILSAAVGDVVGVLEARVAE